MSAEQVLRDLRINRIFEGSSEIMRLLIAREAVDAHLSAAGALAEPDARRRQGEGRRPSERVLRQMAADARGRSRVESGRIPRATASSPATCGTSSGRPAKLARQTFYGMARWQAGLEHRQAFLGRVVDIGAELFAMAAVCSRATTSDEAPEGSDQQRSAIELADVFCQQARLRVEALFEALWHNCDDADRGLADAVLAGEAAWLEAGVLDASEGTGPWIADWTPGPSTRPNVRRHYR